jgi:hypothetical protein
MTTAVSRVQGNYIVQSSTGSDILVVDTSGIGYNITSGFSPSKVVITGDLYVMGRTISTSSSVVQTIQDPTLILNFGNTFTDPGSDGVSGIEIDRTPNNPAYIQWNENTSWTVFGGLNPSTGYFEIRTGPSGDANYSAIKLNKILVGDDALNNRLNLIGAENTSAVVSVSGTVNYENNVTDPDDIPNKTYVDNISRKKALIYSIIF